MVSSTYHYYCSHAFGFGLMDAGKMVEMAENWEKVPEQQKCSNEYNGGRENKTRKQNLFFQQNQNKLVVNPGEEAVRAGWQKRLNITVSDCDQVQVLHLNLNYETFFHVSLDFSMTNIILSLSLSLCLIKSIFSATLTHRCWSMCTWLLTSHRGTNVASSRSG